MNNKKFAKAYKTTALETASPGRIVLMLFDGALRFISAAKISFNEEDSPRKNESINNNIVKAKNIVLELQSSLDLKTGGEFASRMFELYDFMYSKLGEANLKKEIQPLHDVEKHLLIIRDAWNEMLNRTSPIANTNPLPQSN